MQATDPTLQEKLDWLISTFRVRQQTGDSLEEAAAVQKSFDEAAERADEELAAALTASQVEQVKASLASATQAEAALANHPQIAALPSGQVDGLKSYLKAAEIADADGDLANAEAALTTAKVITADLTGLADRLQQRAQLLVQQQQVQNAWANLQNHAQFGGLPGGTVNGLTSVLEAGRLALAEPEPTDADITNATNAIRFATTLHQELTDVAARLAERAALVKKRSDLQADWEKLQQHEQFPNLSPGAVSTVKDPLDAADLVIKEAEPTTEAIKKVSNGLDNVGPALADLTKAAERLKERAALTLKWKDADKSWKDLQTHDQFGSLPPTDTKKAEEELKKAETALSDTQPDDKVLQTASAAVVQAETLLAALLKRAVVGGSLAITDQKAVALASADVVVKKTKDREKFQKRLVTIDETSKEAKTHLQNGELTEAETKAKVVVELVESFEVDSQFVDDGRAAYLLADAAVQALGTNDPHRKQLEARLKKVMEGMRAAAQDPQLRIAAVQRLNEVPAMGAIYQLATAKRTAWSKVTLVRFKANSYPDVEAWIADAVAQAESGDPAGATQKLNKLDALAQLPEVVEFVSSFAQMNFTGNHEPDLANVRQAVSAALAQAMSGDFAGALAAAGKTRDEADDLQRLYRDQNQFPRLRDDFKKEADVTLAAITSFEQKWGNANPIPTDLNNAKIALTDYRNNLTIQTLVAGRQAHDEAKKRLKEAAPVLDLSLNLTAMLVKLASRNVPQPQRNLYDQRLTAAKVKLTAGNLTGAQVDLAALNTEFEVENKNRLTALEAGGDTHLDARHGADSTVADLKTRLTTGATPDGAVAPAQCCSKFLSYDEMLSTLSAALTSFGLTIDDINAATWRPHRPHNDAFEMDHGHEVGEGYLGAQSAGQVRFVKANGTAQNNANGTPRKGDVYAMAFLQKFTRTQTRVKWEGGLWSVTQHHPI